MGASATGTSTSSLLSYAVDDGIETDDFGLDLIVYPDGSREWKDVEDLHHQRVEGRVSATLCSESSLRRLPSSTC